MARKIGTHFLHHAQQQQEAFSELFVIFGSKYKFYPQNAKKNFQKEANY